LYFKGPLRAFSFIKGYLQKYDIKSAFVPDYLISNSVFVQKWVKEKYKRESVVIYPPVEVDDFYISEDTEDYYITVGRLEPYKRFDIVIEAFTKNNKNLIVVGDGSQLKYLKSIAGKNIQFVGYLDKSEIRNYLSKAKAFVYAGVEDFGIALVEAHASGIPVIVYKGGASQEIVTPENGLCYANQDQESLGFMVGIFENQTSIYNKETIRQSALKFSKKRFQDEFSAFITALPKKQLVAIERFI
jgi:glycosyltransferase involved in cell wall biosynthesis